jgi:uncharacterized protein YgiB involved in biofilm formation
MKHSRVVALTLSCSFVAVSLAGCGPDTPSKNYKSVYESVKECVADSRSQSDCKDYYNSALNSHLENAPRYVLQKDCLAEGSNKCVEIGLAPDSVWLPEMVGFTAQYNPAYLSKTNTSNPNDRVVVEPSNNGDNTFIMLGSYYNSGSATRLSEGMTAGNLHGTSSRVFNSGVTPGSYTSTTSRSGVASVSRGGFGSRGGAGS